MATFFRGTQYNTPVEVSKTRCNVVSYRVVFSSPKRWRATVLHLSCLKPQLAQRCLFFKLILQLRPKSVLGYCTQMVRRKCTPNEPRVAV